MDNGKRVCFSVEERSTKTKNETKLPAAVNLWGSVRLTYTICAFLAMLMHTWLRNTIHFLVLCMLKNNKVSNATGQFNSSAPHSCNNMDHIADDTNMQKTGDLEWSRSEEFLILSSFYVGYMIIIPFAGLWADKYGGKVLFINSLTVQAIIFILTPTMLRWHYVAGFCIRLIQGVISGLGNPAIYQLFGVWSHPSERTALMSFAYGGFLIGSILAYPISGLLCLFGWENTFYAVGLIVLLISLPFRWLVYSTLDEHPRISEAEYEYLKNSSIEKSIKIPWKCFLTSMPVYSFTFTHILHSYGIIVITITLPKMLRETMFFGLSEISYYSTFPFLGGVLSKAMTLTTFGRIEKLFKFELTKFRRVLYVLTCAITILCLYGVIRSTCSARLLVIALYTIIGFFTDLGFAGAYWPSMLYVAPSFAGLIAGIANCLSTLSGIIAPIMTSAIVTKGTKQEWNYVIYSIIASYLLAAIIFGFWGSSKLQPWGKANNDNKNPNKIIVVNQHVCDDNEIWVTKL